MAPDAIKEEDRLYGVRSIEFRLDLRRGTLRLLRKQPFRRFPDPDCLIGTRERWKASTVWGWLDSLASQESPELHPSIGDQTEAEDALVAPKQDAVARYISEAKYLYESGWTLDRLCRKFKVGKARLSSDLRSAGTELRKPGRRPSATNPDATASVSLREGASPWPFA